MKKKPWISITHGSETAAKGKTQSRFYIKTRIHNVIKRHQNEHFNMLTRMDTAPVRGTRNSQQKKLFTKVI